MRVRRVHGPAEAGVTLSRRYFEVPLCIKDGLARASDGSRPLPCRRSSVPLCTRGAREPEKDEEGPIEPKEVLVAEPADAGTDLGYRHCRELVDAQAARLLEAVLRIRRDRQPKQSASVGSGVKAQIVIDAVLSKLSSWMITAGRGLPALSFPLATAKNLSAPHASGPTDTESMNAWSSFACGLATTARD